MTQHRLLLATILLCACTWEKPEHARATAEPETAAIVQDSKEVEDIDSYQGVKGTAFVVKNYLQLKTAAEACLGPGLGVVRDDMFAAGRCGAGQPAASPTGDRLVILGADKCAARGQNIYDVLKDQLWSPELAGRTDTLANELTPAYLQALAQAADVYAHTVENPAELCSTDEAVKALLGRCIAPFAAADLDRVADAIKDLCAQGGAKSREALATILGSAAFAAAAPKDKVQDAEKKP